MTRHDATKDPFDSSDQGHITLRSPAELADALPYLLGFHPSDSIVMVALHGPRGRFGGRLRLGIPDRREEWADVCDQLAECLVTGSERRGARPDGIVLFLCQDPSEGEAGRDVMERLRPLAQRLRIACGGCEVPVYEALCISDGRFWSYCCPDRRCCPVEGVPLPMPGTSVMAAAATYAGVQVRGSLRDMEARLAPMPSPRAEQQEQALDTAGAALVPRILGDGDCGQVRRETLTLVGRVLDRFRAAGPLSDLHASDLRDDGLVSDDEAAAVIIGLQDRVTRDRAAEWMEGADGEAALRLWRSMARRCVGSYAEHAAPPLTLAGWVAWSTGDEPAARVALGRALRADPGYHFARLLHQACNEGLDPELLRRCLRRERADQALHAAVHDEACRAEAVAGVVPRQPLPADCPAPTHGQAAERREPRRTDTPAKADARLAADRETRPAAQGSLAGTTDAVPCEASGVVELDVASFDATGARDQSAGPVEPSRPDTLPHHSGPDTGLGDSGLADADRVDLGAPVGTSPGRGIVDVDVSEDSAVIFAGRGPQFGRRKPVAGRLRVPGVDPVAGLAKPDDSPHREELTGPTEPITATPRGGATDVPRPAAPAAGSGDAESTAAAGNERRAGTEDGRPVPTRRRRLRATGTVPPGVPGGVRRPEGRPRPRRRPRSRGSGDRG